MTSNYRRDISNEYYPKSIDTTQHDSFNDESIQMIQFIKELSKGQSKKIGFTCSTFDLLHPGHVIMLKDSKDQCDILVVGIQSDPTLDRPDIKNDPIQSFEERKIMLDSCRFVNYVIEYSTENDLYNILSQLKPDVRILGSDWEGKKYTGYDIEDIDIHWHDRSGHSYSTTNLRKRIYHAEMVKNQ